MYIFDSIFILLTLCGLEKNQNTFKLVHPMLVFVKAIIDFSTLENELLKETIKRSKLP